MRPVEPSGKAPSTQKSQPKPPPQPQPKSADLFRLQHHMQKLSEMSSMLSQIQKQRNDTAQAIISNIR